jgi:hypothetical protein
MSEERATTVDFVAKGEANDEWKMVLVEQGPWSFPIEDELRRIQDRLYGCIDAALGGQLAEKFPESLGKRIVIQLDCYNLPVDETKKFFTHFADGVLKTPTYSRAMEESSFVKAISFELNFDSIH